MSFTIHKTQFKYHENKLWIDNKEINCPQKIRRATILFIESDNQIISKEKLIQELWGDIIVSDDSLFKIIQELRKLFKNYGLNGKILINVYGKGYKIEPKITKLENQQLDSKSVNKVTISPKKNAQPLNRSDKINWSPYIIIFLLLVLITFLYIHSQSVNDNSEVFTLKKYSELKQQISSTPTKTLLTLNKKYHFDKLHNNDKNSLSYLKGWAHFNRGNFKQAMVNLNQVKSADTGIASLTLADTYLLLAEINLYRSEHELMLAFLNKADEYYAMLNNTQGIYLTTSLRARYFILIHQYQQSIKLSLTLLEKAKKNDDFFIQIKANLAISDAYSQLNDINNRGRFLKDALELALQIGNGKYIAYAYGSMAVDSMNDGDFINAMNWANRTLRYAVVQPSTNNFQQGFSYLYNILSTLGHDQLAEKYLQEAINIQSKFDSEGGHLHMAELNLGVLKVKLKKYQQANNIFNTLLTYNLTKIERQETNAWKALNHFFLKDNISAYTTAKQVFNNKQATQRLHFIAGIALVLSSTELERAVEAEKVFDKISTIINHDWLIEYRFYLEMALYFFKEDEEKHNHFINLKKHFDKRMTHIKNSTQPDIDTLNELDEYINKVLK